jgi:CubicO group peptidase (beta-lactamase class C family)
MFGIFDRSSTLFLASTVLLAGGCSRDPGLGQPGSKSEASAAPVVVSANAATGDAALGAKPTVDVSENIGALAAPFELPGVAIAVFHLDQLVGSGVYGYRKSGDPTAIGPDDKWPLGSCTKAITATIAGTLVDQNKLSFDDTLDKLLPGVTVHPTRAKATLMMLLQHHGGMEREPDAMLVDKALSGGKDPAAARKELTTKLLARPNEKTVGTYAYSNVGYLAATLAIERAAGQSYESLVRERIFKPLDMTSCGFGPPHQDETGHPSQPVGHAIRDGKLQPAKRAAEKEIAELFAPTTAIHCSLADWGKFLRLHQRKLEGVAPVVSPASLRRLHTPQFNKTTAAGFWFEPLQFAGMGMHQFGASGTFYSEAWLAPSKDLTFLLATNTETTSTRAGSEKIFEALFKRFGK